MGLVRIKTESQFLQEFGENWRNDVQCTFPSDMDHLLGEEILISEFEYYEFEEENYALHYDVNMSWQISKEMIMTYEKQTLWD